MEYSLYRCEFYLMYSVIKMPSTPEMYHLFCLNYCWDRIKLYAPPTSTSATYDSLSCYREGFIIALFLEDGSVGFGEVSVLHGKHQRISCLLSLLLV